MVSLGVATNNKSEGSYSKGRRGYRGGYYNGGTPQKKKFEGAVEQLSVCIFDLLAQLAGPELSTALGDPGNICWVKIQAWRGHEALHPHSSPSGFDTTL